MKKLLSLVLVVAMVCSLFASVSVSAAGGMAAGGGSSSAIGTKQTYGVDNLNNKEGDLVIGFIGGSVTEGSGASPITNRWSSLLVKDYFQKKYPNKNVIERNAGIGGTTSTSGHTRILGDLECYGEKSPDVVFIEFVINDHSEGTSMAPKHTQNMESMVRQLLRLPKVPAIVIVYLTGTDSDTKARRKTLDTYKEAHKKVVDNYGLFAIDIDKYIWDGVADGKWTWNSVAGSKVPYISNDTAHPTNDGYRIYADYMIEQLEAHEDEAFKKLDKVMPACSTYVYGELEEVLLSDPRVTLTGEWEHKPAGDPDWSKTGYWVDKFAPEGYYVTEDGPNSSVELEFTGRGIGFQVVRTHHNAKFKWEVYNESGALVKNGTKSVYYKSDSTRVVGNMLATDLPFGKYKIKITGVLNETALKDNESDPSKARTGMRMPIVCFMVEKGMPEIHPVAKEVKFEEAAVVGATLNGSYKFECNTYSESKEDTLKAWYVSDKIDGTYTEFADGESLNVGTELVGKYIKYGVTPFNNSEYKTAGKTAYSEPALVTRQTGMIASTTASIKVDGAASDKLGAGTNVVSVDVTNEGVVDCTVYLTVALNETIGGISKTNAVKVVPKLIPAGKTETVSAEMVISADDTYTDAKIMVVASDSLEPAKVISRASRKIEFVGSDTDGASVYKVSYMK